MADSESKLPFTEGGKCPDEVVFEFDDDQKLYVSQNFLRYVSPVFIAMFEHDFKEKETRTVKFEGKRYEDFLEFLLCLHPNEQKPVDERNVLDIASLAEEYQTKAIIRKCKTVMAELLESELNVAKGKSSVLTRLKKARTCLKILRTAELLQYEETVSEACKVLGQFGHALYTGTVPENKVYSWDSKHANNGPLTECKTLYDELPDQLQNRLLLERLRLRDDLNMYKD